MKRLIAYFFIENGTASFVYLSLMLLAPVLFGYYLSRTKKNILALFFDEWNV